jgi:hypothetical protein
VPWLQQQLANAEGTRRQIVIGHVPPSDQDFDSTLVKSYTQTVAQAPQLVFHLSGHINRFGVSMPYKDGTTYISGYSVQQRQYLLFTVWGRNQYTLDKIAY